MSQAAPEESLSAEALDVLRSSVPAQQRQRATALIEAAEELNRDGDWEQAVELLTEAANTDPTYAQPHIWLGYIHQQQYAAATTVDAAREHRTAAITAYAGALAIAPEDEYSRRSVSGLLFDGEFPRTLDVAALGYTPTRFIVSNCRLTGIGDGGAAAQRGWAYTASVVFPPEHEDRTGIEVWPQDPRELRRYNRVSYGYAADPESKQLHLRFIVYYPSAGLARPVVDHTPLAHRVMRSLLRLHCYATAYLGDVAPVPDDDVVHVWLADRGSPGAEQMQSNILLYDIAQDREPVEWLREVAHEYGHQVLPHIGYFETLDEDASGLIGERLFMRWLAEDALGSAEAPWPSPEAQNAFDALWSRPAAVGEFLLSRCDAPINFWLQEGPESQYLGGQTRKAAEYFVGLVLYIEAAHGRHILAGVLRQAHGRAASDVVKAYENVMAAHLDRTALQLDASLFVPDDSTIHSSPHRTLVSAPGAIFAPDEQAAYRLYLPQGRWHVRLEQDEQQAASFAVSLDGEQEQSIVLGAETSPRGAVFNTATADWHELRIKLVNAEDPIRLLRALISAAPRPAPL